MDKLTFSGLVIIAVAAIQIAAFVMGHNGAVFNFTAIIIGGIVGAALGITFNIKGSVKEYVKEKDKLP